MPHKLLSTERLLLRSVQATDVDHLYALDNDLEVMRWINGGKPVSREHICVECLEDKEFLGWVCMRATEKPNEVSIGYRFARKTWGNGFATEAVGALIHEGLMNDNISRIVANTYEENVASQRLMDKLGMKLSRRYRFSETELRASDTSHSSGEVWQGDELEYSLEHDAYVR
jgi:RimJ/RimL family protein N-acetyltransferase